MCGKALRTALACKVQLQSSPLGSDLTVQRLCALSHGTCVAGSHRRRGSRDSPSLWWSASGAAHACSTRPTPQYMTAPCFYYRAAPQANCPYLALASSHFALVIPLWLHALPCDQLLFLDQARGTWQTRCVVTLPSYRATCPSYRAVACRYAATPPCSHAVLLLSLRLRGSPYLHGSPCGSPPLHGRKHCSQRHFPVPRVACSLLTPSTARHSSSTPTRRSTDALVANHPTPT